MPLDADRLGKNMSDAVESISVSPGAAITSAQKQLIWKAVAAAIVAELTGNAAVIPGTFTSPSGSVTGAGKIT